MNRTVTDWQGHVATGSAKESRGAEPYRVAEQRKSGANVCREQQRKCIERPRQEANRCGEAGNDNDPKGNER